MRNKVAKRLRKQAGWDVGRNGMRKQSTLISNEVDTFIVVNPEFKLYKQLKREHKHGKTLN